MRVCGLHLSHRLVVGRVCIPYLRDEAHESVVHFVKELPQFLVSLQLLHWHRFDRAAVPGETAPQGPSRDGLVGPTTGDMKYFSWNAEKNEHLKGARGVSFEQVVFCIERGRLLDIVEHPNQAQYAGQRILIVDIGDYAYLVPFVESEDGVFLKTISPSRKATRKYVRGHGHGKDPIG